MKIFAGITDFEDLSISADFERQTQSEIERLLPGSWAEIRQICVDAKDLKKRQINNKIGSIRSGIQACLANTEKTLRVYETLPTSAMAAISHEAHEKLNELKSIFTIALQEARDSSEFPDGKISLFYREYLAKNIVRVMRKNGVEPKLNRDINNSIKGDDTYAQILRNALELVDDGKASPTDLIRIMRLGFVSENE